jgi:17beta-estradiol 17-dehydrogenase / very-long-chain 3-oxoacyl-CoA reductase
MITTILLYSLAIIGSLFLASKTLALLAILTRALLPSRLPLYKSSENAYAIVTGASAGIGREFSLQLAAQGFNLIILSRQKSTLDALAREVRAVSPETKLIIHPFDFAGAGDEEWTALEEKIDGVEVYAPFFYLKVNVLVNNVAMNHAFPVSFIEEEASLVDDIITVNISSTMRLTRAVLPQMLERKKGLVVNMGSLSG